MFVLELIVFWLMVCVVIGCIRWMLPRQRERKIMLVACILATIIHPFIIPLTWKRK